MKPKISGYISKPHDHRSSNGHSCVQAKEGTATFAADFSLTSHGSPGDVAPVPKSASNERHWKLPWLAAILAVAVNVTTLCQAITFTSGPTLTPSTKAPLAAVLELETDVPSRISVSVFDGHDAWSRDFYTYGITHSLPLLGFKLNRTNEISVTVYDKYRSEATAPEPLVFVTTPPPSMFPKMALLSSQPDKMEPGYTILAASNAGQTTFIVIVDNEGAVVWYGMLPTTGEVRQLENGNLFLPVTGGRSFAEINLLGQTVKTWVAPTGLDIDLHDGVPTDHGTILYLNDASSYVADFPTSATNPDAVRKTTKVMYNRVVEIASTNSALLSTWSLLDMLDPTRINYLTFSLSTGLGVDCQHANAVIEDPRDDSIIVSLRHQDAVVKFSRATGQLKWILGPHENWGPQWQQYLLTPVGAPFEWQYGQHAPVITPSGTLLLYDDGNKRAEPFDPPLADRDNYSRAVEYSINETTMEVSQVWDFGRTNENRLYTDRVGNADWLPIRTNVLITYGYVLYEDGAPPSAFAPNATSVRIKEVTYGENPEVVFDFQVFDPNNTNPNYRGCFSYRGHRIPDLYAHPAMPVEDLVITELDGGLRLDFSADQRHTYTIEASTNLVDWVQVGVPEDSENGEFTFFDQSPETFQKECYYRVLTQ